MNVSIKKKGYQTYKCTHCTAIFTIEAMDNCTELKYCPNCGGENTNKETQDIFEER